MPSSRYHCKEMRCIGDSLQATKGIHWTTVLGLMAYVEEAEVKVS